MDGARITLERDGHTAPFSITCGIYGWMVHSCFFSTQQRVEADFKRMKNELASIVAIISFEDDPDLENKLAPVSDAISRFVEEYW